MSETELSFKSGVVALIVLTGFSFYAQAYCFADRAGVVCVDMNRVEDDPPSQTTTTTSSSPSYSTSAFGTSSLSTTTTMPL